MAKSVSLRRGLLISKHLNWRREIIRKLYLIVRVDRKRCTRKYGVCAVNGVSIVSVADGSLVQLYKVSSAEHSRLFHNMSLTSRLVVLCHNVYLLADWLCCAIMSLLFTLVVLCHNVSPF